MTKRVALTGFSFRLPGCSPADFWPALLAGRNLVTSVPSDRWAQDAFLHPKRSNPGTSYTFAAGTIGDISGFDAAFFGISPREAALLDPQQRLLLELCWETLENAGVPPASLRGSRCGVYIGISSNDYSVRIADDPAAIDATYATGNTSSIAANRISYVFDLRGPSMAIDTACSSALVAFHQACRAILAGDCDRALTGGVSLHLHPNGFISFAKASMLSQRGRCAAFSADADGYVRSEGGGIFLLKDYDRAVADGDPIFAVVAASGVNTDGRKTGMTVPSAEVQASLLEEVCRTAGLTATDLDYVEAHGTGTRVGDPIEAKALGLAFGGRRPRRRPLPIGSVKSNIGHLEAAAGAAGLVKALYSLQYRMIPATIGIDRPNPDIPLGKWNLQLVTANRPLPGKRRLVIGINSFGFGGANAHVLLCSPPQPQTRQPARAPRRSFPLVLSARSADNLANVAREMAAFLEYQPPGRWYDIAWHAAHRREWLPHRLLVRATDSETAAATLREFAADPAATSLTRGTAADNPGGVTFIYSGNGAQWAGMGAGLLADPTFRAAVREVDALFRRHADFSLERELAGRNGADRYRATEIAQPALFALQVGITRMLTSQGVTPAAVAGHSVGEIAAAWAAGILTLPQAVEVIFQRSRLQGETRGAGQMTAVALGGDELRALLAAHGLEKGLAIAGYNSNRAATLAGPATRLARCEALLASTKIVYKRLDLDYAFHSPAMNGIRAAIRTALDGLVPVSGELPFYSTVSGGRLDGTALTADYWWQNVRKPVRFDRAVGALVAAGNNLLIEIGPHPILRQYLGDALQVAGSGGTVIATGRRDDDAPATIRAAAEQALLAGAGNDLRRAFPVPGRFVQLPNYPWQRERHWHPVTAASPGLLDRHRRHPLLGYRLAQQELTFENQLDTVLHPQLADHVVGNATIFPGAGYVEMALAAAAAWQNAETIALENLEIRAPLLLDNEQGKLVRLTIDRRYGDFVISARDLAGESPWSEHAAGRIMPAPAPPSLAGDGPPLLPQRPPDFDADRHRQLTDTAGLCYGPAFRTIRHGWIEGATVYAELQHPQEIVAGIADYHLHPALLDGAFQLITQLLRTEAASAAGLVFIPARIGRVTLHSRTLPHTAAVTLRTRSPHSLSADLQLFDAAGRLVASLREARFQALRLRHAGADQPRTLGYRLVPRPHPQAPPPVSGTCRDRLTAILAELTGEAAATAAGRLYGKEVEPLLDLLCSRYAVEALRPLATADGALPPAGELLSADAASTSRELYAGLCRRAADDGVLIPGEHGWQLQPADAEEPPAPAIWRRLLADYPDFFAAIHAVGRTGAQLPARLAGDLPPVETDAAGLLRQILAVTAVEPLDRALRQLLTAHAAELSAADRFGIVEISAGPPLFRTAICDTLSAATGDYLFLSSSPAALDALRLAGSDAAARLLPQTGLLADAGVAPALPCRMAIVVNDFSSRQETLAALEQARRCLCQGGLLLFVGWHPARWLEFVLDGDPAWQLETPDDRAAQLARLGFAAVQPCELAEGAPAAPYLLTAVLEVPPPAEALPDTPRTLLLLAEAGEAATPLSRQLMLQSAPHLIRMIAADTPHAEVRAVIAGMLASRSLDGIVWLGGRAAAKSDHQGLLAEQTGRCLAVAALLRTIDEMAAGTPCWLVTGGVARALFAEAPQDSDAVPAILQDVTLWGLGRTLLNETASPLRLIDLDPAADPERVVAALLRELTAPDAEQEIFLTTAGARFAPRLGDLPPAAAEKIANRRTRLGFDLPGQLRNLQWSSAPYPDPGPGELDIEVVATGLNFRDLMYALGLLSDEAVENGFAGATLGLEFAGIVRRVGSEVTAFTPGDRVVGFGPGSFTDRMVIAAHTVAPIPEGISCAAAATIPSTFQTAWYALKHLANLRAGEKVLIHSAAGGVGLAAIQIAHWCGAEVHATAGTAEKRDFLQRLGVAAVYDSHTLAFADELMANTGGSGVDVVLNSLAGEALHASLGVLKPFGRFLELGKRDFYANTRLGLRPFRNNISYFGIDADQLLKERPELASKLFRELIELLARKQLHPLPYRSFPADDITAAFRYMQQGRQIGKIVVTYGSGRPAVIADAAVPARLPFACRAAATYLVTGGLRGFGLKLAEWLADAGARTLVLAGRSLPADEETVTALARLRQREVTVLPAICDVTDRPAVAALLDRLRAEGLPPLRGMVHAAAVIDDSLARNLTAAQFTGVFAPKILGALHLHELTRDLPLDFFVLCSSATTLFGNPGQGNYVAANLWLEALAHQRRLAGLPATCIGWGPLDDVGFLARDVKVKEALQKRMGGAPLHSAQALAALGDALATNRSGLAVLHFDWKALGRYLPTAATPKFAQFGGDREGDGATELAEQDLQELLQLGEAVFLPVVIDLVRAEVAGILRLPAERIEADRLLHDLGFDSLMGVELVVAIESRFGIKLPVLALGENLTVARLAERIVTTMKAGETVSADDAEPAIQDELARLAGQHAVEVTAGELADFSAGFVRNRAD